MIGDQWSVISRGRVLTRALIAGVIFACCVAAAGDDWQQAIGPWKWAFPKDHGSHPGFRTEWWYFTGNLLSAAGERFGYQLTFFRQGVARNASDPANPWSIRDVYLAHFTLTDVARNKFWYAERLSRKGPGLADAREQGMDVRLLNWSAKMQGSVIVLNARHQAMELALRLTPRKPIVFHGDNGLSKKGPADGQASYYFSFTDLDVHGHIKTPSSDKAIDVRGTSWFDHEFGSNQLASNQVGWDWFSLHLSDGHDLMIYFMRRTDGTIEPTSSGTLVSPSATGRHLSLSDISVEVLDRWKSPKSGGEYPSRWRIKIKPENIELVVTPLVASQELVTESSTRITYWEGAVGGAGKSGGREVTCEGYVEMTGYTGSLAGTF